MTFRHTPLRAALLALAVVAAASCELVLGDLPPVQSTTTGSTTSTSTSGTTGGDGACCDCDGDHFEAEGMCGGQDCDDHDALVYPGEPIYYAMPAANPAVGFDWDCSGAPEPNPALNKTVSCVGLPLPCNADTGYLAAVPPPCGSGAPWGTCKQQGVMCVEDVIDQSMVMTCK